MVRPTTLKRKRVYRARPYKRRRTRPMRRRRGRRTRGIARNTFDDGRLIVRTRSLCAFPPKTKRLLVYADQGTFTLTTPGQVYTYTYRANDLFDPYEGVGGHQPLGFDQLMGVYTKAYVIGSKFTLNLVQTSENAGPTTVGMTLLESNFTLPTVQSLLRENGNSSYTYITANDNQASIVKKFSTKKSGRVKNVLDNFDLYCTDAASPGRQWFMKLWGVGTTGSTIIHFELRIEYIAVFIEPKPLPQS